jgi:hypothetical protein
MEAHPLFYGVNFPILSVICSAFPCFLVFSWGKVFLSRLSIPYFIGLSGQRK